MHQISTFQKFLFFVYLLIPFQASFAQSDFIVDTLDYYTIKSEYPIQDLFEKTKILKNNAENISISDLLKSSLKENFQPLKDSVISDSKVIWLRIALNPKLSLPNQQIVFKNTNENFKYTTPHDSILAYYVKNNKIVDSTKSGAFIRASQKKTPFPANRNTFPVSLTKNELVDLYFKIYDQNKIYAQLELREQGIPFPETSSSVWLSAFAFILSIYVLAFFFYTKDTSYLYLFGFYAFVAIYEQFVESNLVFMKLFFSEIPKASIITWIALTLGSKVLFLQFGRKFTALKKISPLWDKIVIGLIIYFILAITIQFILLCFGTNPLNYHQFIFAGIGFLGVLIVTIRLFFFKDTLLKYFVASSIWSFIFSILGILWENNIIPFWDEFNPWLIANTGLMFILALAIARKMQLSERAKLEVEKVREIDTIKSRFFANISHEFRTPLSLILGPVNKSMENIPASESIDNNTEIPVKGKHLKVMKRNALRLQNLVDQILDLSKLDQGEMKLRVRPGNLIKFIRAIVFSFESLTELKHIHFHTHFPETIENTYFDSDKLEKILVNLISNAVKFTPEHGEISVVVENSLNGIKITVSDTGSGMRTEEVNNIFDRFYQSESAQDQGTGIGLSLVKELVELYQGQIHVNSTEGKGTTFKVVLPYKKSDFTEEEITNTTEAAENNMQESILYETSDTDPAAPSENQDLPLLLIVEDNPDLRQYIAEQLQEDFSIQTAKHGVEGLKIAETTIPDIIISDVMMPHMNGTELCRAVKSNEKTSHIPVILLTAKADQKAKLEGLETGADDYITKPFDGRELLVRAQNLIAQRADLREKFTSELKIKPTDVTLTSIDERFVKQVMKEIEHHLGNEYYSVEDLAEAVGFSRSQLNRKLKLLLGKSPNQMIREFRLLRAKEMLEQRSASVSEVAYEVGYTNLSYFSKSFKETFGMLPSEV
jgi:signal transduction histidine kinase/DNA-binding response OmpR family regulator